MAQPPTIAPHLPPTQTGAQVPPSGSRFARFREGLRAPLDGFTYMMRHPRLWRYAVFPILLNVLITGLVLLMLFGAATWFVTYVHPKFPDGAWGTTKEVAAAFGVVMTAGLLAVATWMLLNGILCGYFYSKLAREVELQLGARPEDLREVPFAHQVIDAFRDTASLLGINVALLALHIIPALGSAAAVVLTLYFDSFIFGRDYLDFPLALRGMRREEKLALARARRPETVGLGAAVFLFNLVPVIGSIGLATAATGSVLMHRQWHDAGAMPLRHPDLPGKP